MFCLWWQVFQNSDVLPNGIDHFSIPESRGAVMWVFLSCLGDLSHKELFLTVLATILIRAGSYFPVAHWTEALPRMCAEWSTILTPKFLLVNCLFLPQDKLWAETQLEKRGWERCSREPVFFLPGFQEGTNRGREGRGSPPTLIEVFAGASCVISILGSPQGIFLPSRKEHFAGLHRLTASL